MSTQNLGHACEEQIKGVFTVTPVGTKQSLKQFSEYPKPD